MIGYYKMYRGWMDNPVFGNEPYSRAQAWEWLIGNAAWCDQQATVGFSSVDVRRGQLCRSIRDLAGEWRWEPTRVARFLRRLSCEKMIATGTATGINVITICNYGIYQSPETTTDTLCATATLQQRYSNATLLKELKEGEESNTLPSPLKGGVPLPFPEKISRPSPLGSRLPEKWRPDENLLSWSLDHGLPLERVDLELEKFRDYWASAAGAKGRKANWDATWRNWIRRNCEAAIVATTPADPLAAGLAASLHRMALVDQKRCQIFQSPQLKLPTS